MIQPEWSPNESYLKKFERLAFALVRTRPVKESCENQEIRNKNEWVERAKGLAGPYALALLISIPYLSENSSGPIIVASLLLSALDACLTVWCYTDFESRHGHCQGDLFTCLFNSVGEFPAFLAGWWWVQVMASAMAASTRMLSSIVDSITGRHFEDLLKSALGAFTPLGAPLDFLAVIVTAVPSFMVAFGLEESTLLRAVLYCITTLITISIFGSSVSTKQLFTLGQPIPIIPDRNLYAKILSGASLAALGFLGLYRVCRPDNLTLSQHQHFQVIKRFSLTGCVILSLAFLLYFIESSILNKILQVESLWDGDPPLLWPLQGGWRLIVASLGITALALATFEFLIPLSITITTMANDGLLYRNLRKDLREDSTKWNSGTPLVFGSIVAIQALFIDTKVLLGLASSGLMCIHIVICASMLAFRYQTRQGCTGRRRAGHFRTRPTTQPQSASNYSSQGQGRRILTVSFLNGGIGKLPRETTEGPRNIGNSSSSDTHGDRTLLIDNSTETPIESRQGSASDFSVSAVSGYESDSDPCDSDDTDIDAVVTEYHERVRVAALNGVTSMNPTSSTARRVSFATIALVPCCLALAASLNRAPRGHVTGIMLAVSSGLLSFLLLVVISRQPQKKRPLKISYSTGPNHTEYESSTFVFFHYSIVPWLPAGAIFLHCCLLLESLDLAGTPFAFWLATGLIIYFSYGATKSIAAPPSHLPLSPSDDPESPSEIHQQPILSQVAGNEASSSSNSSSEPYAQINSYTRTLA